ncbi:MAG: hypothetical protein WDM92_11335 [Caulobacteraceae bacterium]
MVAELWFRIPFAGSLLTLYAGLVFFLLAAIGIGLLLSALASTQQQPALRPPPDHGVLDCCRA